MSRITLPSSTLGKRCKYLSVAAFLCSLTAIAATGANPLFNGGDPWVTFDQGMYYYSASYCGVATICLKVSPTLTGLATSPWLGVWNAPVTGPNSGDVWAPEIHKVNGKWYVYYAADDGNNDHHRIFVLQAKTDDPQGQWAMADTGAPNGQLVESTNHWAIDPDVFTAADGNLYAVWSCTNYANGTFPQATCLAKMKDALHVDGDTAQISTPTETWEKRTAAIQEGPVGFTHNGRTYVTYSASASWTTNDYAVGLLTNADGRLLNPGSWWKTGPIFDHHGTAYGTGSVVFIQSPDGNETWNLYHGIDGFACNPSYNCRDIRMQRMSWDSDGAPVLGYPLNPGVPFGVPSGEPGNSTPATDPLWGDAFGDAAEGNASAGAAAGDWVVNSDGSVQGNSLGSTSWTRTFFRSNPNLEDYTVAVDTKLLETGPTSQFPKYGAYAAYSDASNYMSVWIDARNKVLATYGLVNGAIQDWANCDLPAGFDASAFNSVEIRKTGSLFSVLLNGAHIVGACNDRTFNLINGQAGLVTEDSRALYRKFRVIPAGPIFTTTSVVNSATYVHTAIAPGEIISLFGRGIGPVSPASAQYSGNPAQLPTKLSDVQVFFDGSPAPLIYVSTDMINLQAPYELAGKTQTMMLVSYNGKSSNWVPVEVAPTDPGLYVAINYDDGTPNSEQHPVTRGHIVEVYGTGLGVVDPPVPTGQSAPGSPLSKRSDVTATVGGVSARLLYSGLVPYFSGLVLFNVEIPSDTQTGKQTLEVTVGGVSTTLSLWLQ